MVEQTTVALIVFMDIISVELGMYKADEYAVMMMMLMLTTNMMAVFMMATMSAACCQSWCVCVSSYGTSTNSYQCLSWNSAKSVSSRRGTAKMGPCFL